ncbi:tektin-1 [Nilaparvata lugens]|uniref:tektin-1 n=1 Tax=Nilaparvata lugens TaxID=108931 RepID=UPI00193E36D1|nr:tektin-1 [Nilaparvata lugens]
MESENFVPNLVGLPPPSFRFTMNQWHSKNSNEYKSAETQHQMSEKIISESERTIEDAQERVVKNKNEVDHQLSVKLFDIEFQKKQLETQKKLVDLEIEALLTYKERIEDAQKALSKNAECICRKCIVLREGRLGIDMCVDKVEIELKKELKLIESTHVMLNKCMEELKEQVRKLRALNYILMSDIKDKINCLSIDKHNATLKQTSLNLSLYCGNEKLYPAKITVDEWEAFTQRNIDDAAKELKAGRPIRSYIDMLLKQVIEDLWKQYNVVNDAFRQRISEYKEAKIKLENQHCETVRQAHAMMGNITQLEKAIADKEGFMALAHTRLGNRCQRPGIELCSDDVESKLMEEVSDITKLLKNLQQMLAESQASLRYLLSTQVKLEEDINLKTNSLKIDEVDCMTLRLGMDYHSY